MAGSGTQTRAPRPVGELMTILRGQSCILGISPREYDGEQKRNRDGVPLWWVDIAWRPADGSKPETLRATYAGEKVPTFAGEWVNRDTVINASYYDFETESGTRKGWSYSIGDRELRQWKK